MKAALSGLRGVPEENGKLQFRLSGYLDVRTSKLRARRALAIMDALIKRLVQSGLVVETSVRDSGFYQGSRQYTYVTEGRECVQITVTEKMYQRQNPAWKGEQDCSAQRFLYDPSGRLILILDDDSYTWAYGCRRKWSDAKGHVVEEYVDEAVTSIQYVRKGKDEATKRLEVQLTCPVFMTLAFIARTGRSGKSLSCIPLISVLSKVSARRTDRV